MQIIRPKAMDAQEEGSRSLSTPNMAASQPSQASHDHGQPVGMHGSQHDQAACTQGKPSNRHALQASMPLKGKKSL
ncbi:hypothetical protein GUJ93_ZPchr0010g8512 [Zizania palustris]|uniref:Uncharacterized protein n=1 Tax=Zizania palustris TaxID=103762 RepID=A0A8J6BML7_ZIZPA|nr:hypothetical protein GUJ93_ZPchr0010g8512 [Zizania palustris]